MRNWLGRSFPLALATLAVACGGGDAEPSTTTQAKAPKSQVEFPGDAVSLLGDLEGEGFKFGTPVISLGKLDGQLNGVAAAGNYKAEVYISISSRAAAAGELVNDGLVEDEDFIECEEGLISNGVKQDPSVPTFDAKKLEQTLLKLYGDC